MKKAPIIIAGYFLVGVFTGSFNFEAYGECTKYDCPTKYVGSFLSGIGWPVYWSAVASTAAIRAFKRSQTSPVRYICRIGPEMPPFEATNETCTTRKS